MGRPRRSHQRSDELLDLGVQRLRAGGYHGTGLKQLLDEAGIPKGSFYNYFPSKEAFAAAVVRRYADQFELELEQLRAASTERPGRALRDFFEGLIGRFEAGGPRGGCLVGNLGAELEGTEPAISQALHETMTSWRQAFAEVLGRAVESGELSARRSPEVLADFLINAWEGALIRMKVQSSVQPLRECIDILFEDLFHGGAPRE